jgi:hypothetical protein
MIKTADINNETSVGEYDNLEHAARGHRFTDQKIEKQECEGETMLTSLSPRYSPAPGPSLSLHLSSLAPIQIYHPLVIFFYSPLSTPNLDGEDH